MWVSSVRFISINFRALCIITLLFSEFKREPVDKTKMTILTGLFDTVSQDCYAYITHDHNEMHITAQDPRKRLPTKIQETKHLTSANN